MTGLGMLQQCQNHRPREHVATHKPMDRQACAPEADDLLAISAPVLKLRWRDKLLDRKMQRGRLQVLPKGQDVDTCICQSLQIVGLALPHGDCLHGWEAVDER